VPRRLAHGDDMSPEEASKDITMYKIWTAAGCTFIVLFGLKLWFAPHRPYPEKKAYTHLEIRHKPWPWGNGDTNMFAQAFGKPGQHGHDEAHVGQGHGQAHGH